MNITKEFQFPKVSDIDMALGGGGTIPLLLEEARSRGFCDTRTPYNKIFEDLFFKGCKLNFKNDLDPKFKDASLRHMTAYMRSFQPRHEDKEAVCALILSELVDL